MLPSCNRRASTLAPVSRSGNDPGAQHVVRRLLPAAEPASIAEFAGDLQLRDAPAPAEPARPRLIVNMIETADGRGALDGRTVSLGNWADRELFHALRAEADAVLVGAGTLREERYGRVIRDPAVRERRRESGRSPEPLAVVVSASLRLPPELPLLAEPEAHVVVMTNSDGELPSPAATVEYVRTPGDRLDLTAALAELRSRFGVELVLCEGGPRLNADLLLAGLVDELFLSISPQLAGGTDALRIVYGPELSPPVGLHLVSVLESESHLFLRYAVAAR